MRWPSFIQENLEPIRFTGPPIEGFCLPRLGIFSPCATVYGSLTLLRCMLLHPFARRKALHTYKLATLCRKNSTSLGITKSFNLPYCSKFFGSSYGPRRGPISSASRKIFAKTLTASCRHSARVRSRRMSPRGSSLHSSPGEAGCPPPEACPSSFRH